jgi:hypothetical protein
MKGYNRKDSIRLAIPGASLSLKKFKNPFYTLLIPVGLVFVITVFAYVLMASTELSGTKQEVREHASQPLFTWLDEHGTKLLLWELGVLGVLTVGAIATDSWWLKESPPQSDQASAD